MKTLLNIRVFETFDPSGSVIEVVDVLVVALGSVVAVEVGLEVLGSVVALGSVVTLGSVVALGSVVTLGSVVAIGSVVALGSVVAVGSVVAIGSVVASSSRSRTGSTRVSSSRRCRIWLTAHMKSTRAPVIILHNHLYLILFTVSYYLSTIPGVVMQVNIDYLIQCLITTYLLGTLHCLTKSADKLLYIQKNW